MSICCDGKQSKTDGTKQQAEEQQRQRGDGLQKRVVGSLVRLETGEAAGISQEIYSGERKDAKVTVTVSALARISVLISLVPSIAEADVVTVDGLKSSIKSARDQKRWKLAAV
ncbi:hypothetical protein B296_00047064 [Ensete ventricosum]|uniref:Uncharacterized protein n=1 Tax=Ensete ventricosum TaxID=4639 RepID=A0A426YNX8_ENSVE|nr:hypothetical protein B296_00047064 [Ensete ventricosum]